MAYTFDDPAAPERRTTQCFEMFGNRGIYHNGWSAVTRHTNLFGQISQDWSEDVWELYDGSTDWSQAHDLAAEMPEKLAELQQTPLLDLRPNTTSSHWTTGAERSTLKSPDGLI